MEELVRVFGIDLRLIIAQIVNFGLLLFVFYRFLYKPVVALMEERQKKIAASLTKAEQIDVALKDWEKAKAREMRRLEREAENILRAARQEAQKQKKLMLAEVDKEKEAILAEAAKRMTEERDRMMLDVQRRANQLVGLALQRILPRALTKEDEQRYARAAAEAIRKV